MTNNQAINKQLIRQLPKAELHIHIEGSLEPEMVMALAERNGISMPYASADELKKLYDFEDLQSFLDLYYQACDVLIQEQDFYDLTWAYLQRCQQDNVVHTEIFFDPQTHTERGVEFATVIEGISRALNDGIEQLGISSQLIMCFLRHLPEASALQTWEQAQPWLHLISGVGLDSSERDFPPHLFQQVFANAKAAGLKLVAHAGEEGPAQFIEEALDVLHVDRIDHGVRITEDQQLIERVAQNNVALTVCPLSNTRLCVYDDMVEHPIFSLLNQGVRVMVNSDDPAYFGGYVNNNYFAINDALKPTPQQMIELIKNSIRGSFAKSEQQEQWLNEIDQLAEEILV